MATIVELDGVRPTIGPEVWLAPTAVLVGDVHVGERASIWFGAVLRGDSARITIGAGTSVQDNAVIHCAHDLPTVVGENVVVGHAAMLEGCVVEDVRSSAWARSSWKRAARRPVGARRRGGALRARRIGPGTLAAGVPAVEKKPLSGSAQTRSETAAAEYNPTASAT